MACEFYDCPHSATHTVPLLCGQVSLCDGHPLQHIAAATGERGYGAWRLKNGGALSLDKVASDELRKRFSAWRPTQAGMQVVLECSLTGEQARCYAYHEVPFYMYAAHLLMVFA